MTIPGSPFQFGMASGSPQAVRSPGGFTPQSLMLPFNQGRQPGSNQAGQGMQPQMEMMTAMMSMMGMMMLMMMAVFSRLLGNPSASPGGAPNAPAETIPSSAARSGGGEGPSGTQPPGQPAGDPQQPPATNGPAPQPTQTVTNIGGNNTEDPDLNLERRGYQRVSGASGLTNDGGPTDPKAPQLASLFRAADGLPQFSSVYQINAANGNQPGGPMAGIATRAGQDILLPGSGYQIDGQGHQARVLYNDGNWLVLNYTAENSIANGYTLHLRIQSDLQPGTNVSAGDVLGQATGSETLVSIRDTGSFMDPRIQKDWWQNTAQIA